MKPPIAMPALIANMMPEITRPVARRRNFHS